MFTIRILGTAALVVAFVSAVLKEMNVTTNNRLLEDGLGSMWIIGGMIAALVGFRLRKSDVILSKILMYFGSVIVILAIVLPAMQPGHGFHNSPK
jgi:peptidoglycan/LPS O-acetylase OafA/YrhL